VAPVRIPAVPRPVGALFSALPQLPHSIALAAAANLLLRNLFPLEDEARVLGKVLRIRVRDAGIRFTLRIVRGGYAPCPDSAEPDATVCADARELMLIALRKEDPDTLFFDRRLVIEGDTEFGLFVKNALDRVELPIPARALALLREHLS
jgi:O2-independent ubiquinone biosynthesis accessory factor UbiT